MRYISVNLLLLLLLLFSLKSTPCSAVHTSSTLGGGGGYDLSMLRLLKEDDVTGVWPSSFLVQPFYIMFLTCC